MAVCAEGAILEDYEERNRILRDMRFASYKDYLDSDLWASIRAKVLDRDDHLCRVCDEPRKPATCVHHASYSPSVLSGDDLSPLFSLCHGCHRKLEFDGTEPDRKLAFGTVAKKTRAYLKTRGKKRKASKPWIGLRHREKYRKRHK